jgi:hypothetical protein
MAPIQYGPSIKALGWLIPQPSRSFFPSQQAMPAVLAFNTLVESQLPPDLFGIEEISVTPEQARALYESWQVGSPTDAERTVFRNLYYDVGDDPRASDDAARRRRTLALIIELLRQDGDFLHEMNIRRVLASGRLASGRPLEGCDNHRGVLVLWSAMQARQLQRLSLEAMLVWVEAYIAQNGNVADADKLVDAAYAAARASEDGADSDTIGRYLEIASDRGGATGWPAACAHDTETEIFDLMDKLIAAQQEKYVLQNVPGLALRGLAYAEAIATALRAAGTDPSSHGPLGGHSDRLPLNAASRRFDALRSRPMNELWREVILSWVLAQHVRWSVARNGDRTQRLRLALDEGGWTRLRSGISGPFGPTPDRLAAALSLAADCGLLAVRTAADGRRVYGVPGSSGGASATTC